MNNALPSTLQGGALLLGWLLAVAGATHVITKGRVFAPLRRLAKLGRAEGTELSRVLGCPLCVGFWVGLFVESAGFRVLSTHSLLGGNPGPNLLTAAVLDMAHGAAAALASRLASGLVELMEQLTYSLAQIGDAHAETAAMFRTEAPPNEQPHGQ